MEERPVIAIQPNQIDRILDLIAWFFLVLTWSILLMSFIKTPYLRPNVFESLIALFPLITTGVFVLLTKRMKYPYRLNYPVPINDSNVVKQYANALTMLRYLRVAIVLLFYFMLIELNQIKQGQHADIYLWMAPIITLLIFSPLAFFVAKAYKLK